MKVKLKTSKKRTLIITSLIVLLFICFIVKGNFENKESNKVDIYKVLDSQYYNSLPAPAKEYIVEYYEQTEEILKVEENKTEGEYYLNPSYIDYLQYVEDKNNGENVEDRLFDYIPSPLTIDNSPINVGAITDPPSQFDLRNYNGNNYISGQKNQGKEGLCWAFATSEVLETKTMLQEEKPYNSSSSLIISPKYYDYALSNNGIKDYDYLDKTFGDDRELKSGGNMNRIMRLGTIGLGMQPSSWEQRNDVTKDELEYADIFSFDNVTYDINGTYYFNDFGPNYFDTEEILTSMKSMIMMHGSAYISGYIAYKYGCEAQTTNGKNIVFNYSYCTNTGSHAEQVIGWDDNIEYNICKKKGTTKTLLSDPTSADCEEGSQRSGKGGWLIRNSWGNSNAFYYIPYTSDYYRFELVTNMGEKTWDNYYKLTAAPEGDSSNYDHLYFKTSSPLQTNQKIDKIRFFAARMGTKYTIYYGKTKDSLTKLGETTSMAFGVNTIDVSSKNIILDSTDYIFEVRTNLSKVNSVDVSWMDLTLLTDNIDNTTSIKVDDFYHQVGRKSDKDNYLSIRAMGYTVGIPENSEVTYKVLDDNNNEVSNVLYDYNVVKANRLFSNIYLPESIDSSKEYKLQTYYNNELKSTSKITFEPGSNMLGGGTKTDPYKIRSGKELATIELFPDSYFELTNDIDLTYDTQDKNGAFYNNGNGWQPIKNFKGSFNGNGHTINGLFSKVGGLFDTITSNNNKTAKVSIGNFKMTNINISSIYNTVTSSTYKSSLFNGANGLGAVISSYTYDHSLSGDANEYMSLDLYDISIISGDIKNTTTCQDTSSAKCLESVGGIIGYIDYTSKLSSSSSKDEHITLKNLFNGANIVNNYGPTGGIIGSYKYLSNDVTNEVTNIVNYGNVNGKKLAGGIIGSVSGFNTSAIGGKLSLKNVINYGEISSTNKGSDIFNESELYDDSTYKVYDASGITLNNVYYVGNKDINKTKLNPTLTNVTKYDIYSIGNADYYAWQDFQTNWTNLAQNGNKRIPMLKITGFEYINFNEDTLFILKNSTKDLYELITPHTELVKSKTTFNVADTNILSVSNGVITPKKLGSTTITINSAYDGFSTTINVCVVESIHGTKTDPWPISLVTDFDVMRLKPDDYYVINNDIEFTSKFTPISLFRGHLDGNNHKLKNLTVDSTTSGLFENISDNADIKNIIFENVNIKTSSYGGVLAGISSGDNININNITIQSGTIIGTNNSYTGGIIGKITVGTTNKLDNLYNNATISGSTYGAGIIGLLNNNNKNTLDINNIMNRGTITSTYSSGLIGKLEGAKLNITNAFQYATVNGSTYSDDIMYTTETTGSINLTNIYIINNSKYKSSSGVIKATNVAKKTISEIVNATYSSWPNFTSGFKQETINGIKRLPLGKYATVEHTVLKEKNIRLYEGNTKNIYELFENTDDSKNKLLFSTNNDNIQINNGVISINKYGTTIITVTNEIDGFIDTIEVITQQKTVTVSFDANGGKGTMIDQTLRKDTPLNENTFTKDDHTFKYWNTASDGSGTTYQDKANLNSYLQSITTYGNLKLYAIWDAMKYPVKDDYIMDIKGNMTKESFTSKVQKQENETVMVYDESGKEFDNDKLICTGSITKIYNNNKVVKTYTNIVLGDTNRDGIMDLSDVAKTYYMYMHNNFTDELLKYSGDANKDSTIDLSDVAKMYYYYMHGKEL